MSTTQLANAVMGLRESLIVDAVNHALGRSDWTLEEVVDRGTLTYYGPNECLFMFDGRPMLELYILLNQLVHDESQIVISTTNYRKLYDES